MAAPSTRIVQTFDHATLAPTTNDNLSQGFGVFCIWIKQDTNSVYICTDSSTSAATWVLLSAT